MYAKVIIDIKHQEVNRLFDYIVPQKFEDFLAKGMRVMVPFGSNERMGIVIELTEKSDDATKSIIEVLDVLPTLDEEQFLLIDELSKNNHALFQKIIETVIPNERLMSYQKVAILKKDEEISSELKPFFNKKGLWRLKKKDQIYQHKLTYAKRKGIIEIETIIKEKTSIKYETCYQYNHSHTYAQFKDDMDLKTLFSDEMNVSKNTLIEHGYSVSRINTLVKHEVIIPFKKELKREIKHGFDLDRKPIKLNNEQEVAVNQIYQSLEQNKIFLLKGITASGKTEVYLNAIQKVINNNKQVLFLVPEIALISPMAQYLKSRFDHVFIYHSGLSKGERFDQLRSISAHQNSIVLGTRNASFLPLDHLGLIIMDEEHDDLYQIDEGIMYHVRDILKFRAKYHHIPLILGSATPSILSMYQAEQKKYQLLELNKRATQTALPTIHFVDMKEELRNKNTTIFSNQLKEAIQKRLEKKEQVMLLYNRKGHAPFVLCRQCGNVPKCPHCDVSLTYYKDNNMLKCHYCGYEKPFSQSCEVCNAQAVKEMGIGIDYVYQVLKKTFPNAKVLRLDASVTKTKGSHESIWMNFQDEKADILLGTQMISKGLDFKHVTLVGVLMADLTLSVPSFMAYEKTYQLLTQITGRSGRYEQGEAIIQGYKIEHFAIQSITKPYEVFYKEALHQRKLLGYEPFNQTAQILISGQSYLKTYQKAFLLKKKLEHEQIDALGPSQALIKKIKDEYRFTITIKTKEIKTNILFKTIDSLQSDDVHIKYYPILDIV